MQYIYISFQKDNRYSLRLDQFDVIVSKIRIDEYGKEEYALYLYCTSCEAWNLPFNIKKLNTDR